MSQHFLTCCGRFTLRTFLLLWCLFTPMYTKNHSVYRLTFEVSSVQFAGTDDEVNIHLYSHNRSINTRLNGERKHFKRNKTDVFAVGYKDIGPICHVAVRLSHKRGDQLLLNKLTVTHVPTTDIGIFIPYSSEKMDVIVSSKSKNFTRFDTLWQAWGECSCDTSRRWRRRYVPNCGAKALNESQSQYCQSISVICDSQKTYIIVGSVLGFFVLILAVVVSLWCIKKRPQSAPTINIKMTPKDDAPVTSLRPELGSTLRLEMIQHGDSALTPQPKHRMMVPRTTPRLTLLEEEYSEEEYLEEMYSPSSVLPTVQGLPYDELYYS